jgi:hypothetical protein
MDHIQPPQSCSDILPHVPYLCREGFDEIFARGGFFAYPALCNFSLEKLDYSHHNSKDLNPFLQEWLYFGLLTEIMAIKKIQVVTADFLRMSTSGTKVLNSKHLPGYMRRWKSKSPRVGLSGDTEEMASQAIQLYLKAEEAFVRLGESANFSESRDNILSISTEEALHLSIALLLEAIRSLVATHEWSSNRWERLSTPYLTSILHAKNRCTYQNSGFLGRPSELFFLSLLPKLNPMDHSKCSRRECLGSNINPNDYKQKHMPDCPGCDPIGPDPEDIVAMYDDRPEGFPLKFCIPVISVVDEGETLRWELLYSGQTSKWTAISHVWADGLGNHAGNTIPTCQLRNIANLCNKAQKQTHRIFYYPELHGRSWVNCILQILVFLFLSVFALSGYISASLSTAKSWLIRSRPSRSSLTSKTAFWLDTLCVPVASVNSFVESGSTVDYRYPNYLRLRACRNCAITEMRQIYQTADQILVLDSDIQKIDGGGLQERIYRVQLSNWMTRLWTFQEGFCNPETYFQTRNGAIWAGTFYFGTALSLLGMDLSSPLPTLLKTTLISTMVWGALSAPMQFQNALRRFEKWISIKPVPIGCALQGIIPLLAARSTSNTEDQAVCVANLMGIPELIPELLELSMQERMTLLLSRLGPIFDINLMFTPGARIDVRGFRWAPISLLSKSSLSDTETLYRLFFWIARYVNLPKEGPVAQFLSWYIKRLGVEISPGTNYLTYYLRDFVPLAVLTDRGLQCQSPGWIYTWLDPVQLPKGWEHCIYLGSDDLTGLRFCSPSKGRGIYAVNAWTSDEVLEELPKDFRRGTSAIIWEPALAPSWSDPECEHRGILVSLREAFDPADAMVSVSYLCRVEVTLKSLEEWASREELADNSLPSVTVMDALQGWKVD